ncbi:uncharacterized protein [Amphiura filiformis]|uniref:uncharacterized protein isoform X2 n=1 Tax=Amphiura filiformis TaxID=82378 RepID=UPI003B218E9E
MADLCDRVGIILIKILAIAIVGFPLFSIFIGTVIVLDDPATSCPVQPMIPMYLIVLGSITIAYEIVCFLQVKFLGDNHDNNDNFLLFALGWFLALCFIGWVITGVVFYGLSVSKQSSDDSSPNYCYRSLYMYFSSQVILASILLIFVIFWIFCLCCLSPPSRPNPETQSIIHSSYSAGRRLGRTPAPATIQTVQRDRLRIIRRGPNLYWIYQTSRVTAVQVET